MRQACWTIEPLWPICDCQKIQNSLTENISLGINSLNQHDLKHKVLIIICMAGSPSNRKYTRSHRYYWDFPSSYIWGFLAVTKSPPAPVMFKLFCTCGSWAWKLFCDLKGWKYYITPQLNNQLLAISFIRKEYFWSFLFIWFTDYTQSQHFFKPFCNIASLLIYSINIQCYIQQEDSFTYPS